MVCPENDHRSEPRTCFEPRDTGYLLTATIAGQEYTFSVLNICHGGIGILVRENQRQVLASFIPGTRMRMDYINPKGSLTVTVEIRHVTQVLSGDLKGLHTVGFSMSV